MIKKTQKTKTWYHVREIKPNVFEVHEKGHVSFFVLKHKNKALLIDAGLGLEDWRAQKLLKRLGIEQFDVVLTHMHCDHIGLCYLAKKVYAYKKEWDKFNKQNETKHLPIYYKLLKDTLPWPKDYKRSPKNKPFKPTHYIKLNQNINFGPFILKPMLVPGHTCGGLCFYEKNLNTLFLGDFAYNGILYFNLNDSTLKGFIKSVDKIYNFIHKKPNTPLLLPGHNDIPLDPAYLHRLKTALTKLTQKKLKPKGRWPFAEFFHPSKIYIYQDVRMVVRNDQMGTAE